MTLSVAILGTDDDWEYGLRGKLSETHFLGPFRRVLADAGIATAIAAYESLERPPEQWDAAIFGYAEVRAQIVPETGRRLDRAAAAAAARGIHVVHPPSLGRILANKALTAERLAAAGIAVPRSTVGMAAAPFPVFSNEFMSTQAKTRVVPAGDPLDPARYNTEWIDTRHRFRDGRHFVALRLMAVGPHRTATLIRARTTAQGNPSVHNKNTPLDADLLNHLHETIVEPNADALDQLCARIGATLGLGFYAHDVLVERDTGRFVLCESGFKFEDASYRERLGAIAGALAFGDALTPAFAERSAARFADELRRLLPR